MDHATRLREIESLVERTAARLPGLAVGFVADGRDAVLTRGRTDGDGRAPNGTTIFEIGSVTKVVTATLLAEMATEGLVALDDHLQRFLPPGVRIGVRGRPMTLLDLATHTSGLPRLPLGWLLHGLRHRDDPYADITQEMLDGAVRAVRLRSAPGERVRYSNLGAGLLGNALATAAGSSYEALAVERIGRPLAMGDTRIAVPETDAVRVAGGHDSRGRPVAAWHLPTLAGAGALRSTVADLLRFLHAQIDPPPSRLGTAISETHLPRARRGILSVGLGWMITPVKDLGIDIHWHNGGTGGFRSYVGFIRDVGVGVVVLANGARSVDRLGIDILRVLSPRPG